MELAEWLSPVGTVVGVLVGFTVLAGVIYQMITSASTARITALENQTAKMATDIDHIKEGYVREKDMAVHVEHLDSSIDEVKSDVRLMRSDMHELVRLLSKR